MKGFRKNGLDYIASKLPEDRLQRAKMHAEQEIFMIKLSELRKKNNIRQTDIDSFSQSSLSKLEARKDMKISTLLEYLRSIGMHLEIKAYPEGKTARSGTVLVRS